MPVYHFDKLWPDGKLPYVEDEASKSLEPIISMFNDALGRAVVVPRTNEVYFAKFQKGGHGCSKVGCQKTQNQLIMVKGKEFGSIHEICHCLGFEHEQFHPEFLWNDDDFIQLAKSTADPSKKLDLAQKGVKNGSELTKFMHDKLAEKLKKNPKDPNNTFAVDQFIVARTRVLSDSGVGSTLLCDYNSIMMYGDWRSTAVEARNNASAKKLDLKGRELLGSSVTQALLTGDEKKDDADSSQKYGLTASDIMAIKSLYFR